MREKDLMEDEKFLVEAKSRLKQRDLQLELEQYFSKKYNKEITINYNDDASIWEVSTRKGKKSVSYPESIPKAVHSLL